ncbi:MAG: chemotaxis protein CheA, partial [Longimicrobiales bacterium]
MSAEDLSARLRATFIQELEDQLRAIDACLLELETRPDDAEAIRTLFRAAHSVKGAARVAGVPLVEEACHALETIFAQVRDGTRRLDGGDFSLLFAACDALGDAGQRLQAGEPVEDGPLALYVPRIRSAAETGTGTEDDTQSPRTDAQRAQTAREVAAAMDAIQRAAAELPAQPAMGPADEPAGRDSVTISNEVPEADGSENEGEPVAAARRAEGTESVRVAPERLDDLAAHVTDLLTTSGSVAQRPAALVDMRADLAQWAIAWRRQRRELTSEREREQHADLDRRLHQIAERAAQIARAAEDEARVLVRATDDILSGVRGLRMRRFADAVEALPRAVRDVSTATHKPVDLVIAGEDVEADRVVIDVLREPLLHLVRNAVDHGIEAPAERRARGKPERGTVRVAAILEQGRLQIIVEDDGGGIDVDAVRRRLVARGEEAPRDGRSLARRLLAGGVTTKEEATSFSGRGVGLDIVRAALERIGGSVELRWKAGEFTRFILDSPPSPTTLRAVVADVGGQLFALPIGQVERVVRVDATRVRDVEGRPALMLGDAPITLATLAGILGPPLRDRTDIVDAQALILRSGTDALGVI